jgi:MFS family permease
MVLGIVGYVLMAQSGTQVGNDYWRFIFTGGIIGSAATMVVFTATNVGVMTSVPPEMAGVAGAVLQVSLQVGSAIALSVQAGLLTIEPDNLYNWRNIQYSFYFEIGWGILWLIGFVLFYRATKTETKQDEAEEGRVVAHF